MKLQPFAKVTILYQLISNLAWVITLGRLTACQIWFGSDERSRRHVGATYTGPVTFLFFVLYSSTELQPIPVNQFSHTITQKTRSGVRKALFRMRCVVVKFGGFYPPKKLKMGRKGQLPAKIRDICQQTLITKLV